MRDWTPISDSELRALLTNNKAKTPTQGVSVQGKYISGMAIPYGVMSEDLGGYREIIQPGAAKGLIGKKKVRVLIDHLPTKLLGDTTNGTLTFTHDPVKGVRFSLSPMDTSYARDLLSTMKQNPTAYGVSVRFKNPTDEWRKDGANVYRFIKDIGNVVVISLTAFPHYKESTAQVQSQQDRNKAELAYAESLIKIYKQ
jgi:HK97 family phage prohead protease